MLPFEGIKVLDFSQGIAGPHCGMLFALYGADVIKIEPLEGDWSRPLGTVTPCAIAAERLRSAFRAVTSCSVSMAERWRTTTR